MVTVQQGILQGLDMGFIVVIVILILFAIGLVTVSLLYVKSFKHKIRIKDVINNRKIISDDFFKEIKDKDGTTWYKLFKARTKISAVPSEAIETNDRGQKVVEVYKIGIDEYIPIVDKNIMIPNEIINIQDPTERKKKLKDFLATHDNTISTLQPLTTDQRVILVEQIKKAQTKKSNRWQDFILPITSIAALVILVVCLMIFWGDIAKPILDVEQIRQAQLVTQKETLEIIKEIKNDIQVMKDINSKTNTNKAPN